MPWKEWAAVKTGEKRMFRLPAPQASLELRWPPYPCPILLYTRRIRVSYYDDVLAVLEEFRHEPLLAISPEDLALEGFDSIGEFRRYWNARHRSGRGFDPQMTVAVLRVRPWQAGDRARFGEVLFNHLYGELCDEPAPLPA